MEWEALKQAWGGCAYCGASGPVQKDCMLPIANGGRYTLSNVVPACASCNASKGPSELTTWMRRKKLDEPGFLLQQQQIRTLLNVRIVATPAPDGRTSEAEATERHTPRGMLHA